MKFFLGIVVLLGITLPVHAAPLTYELAGQIVYRDSGGVLGAPEDFTGTWVLSDPTITDMNGSSVGDYGVVFNISGFSLSSNSYSLTQTGVSYIRMYWEGYPTPTWFNGIDSCMWLVTTVGTSDCTGFGYAPTSWNGDWDAQPNSIINISDAFYGGSGPGDDYYIRGMMATVVPIPATLWLFGSGLLALVGISRRNTVA